MRYYSTLGWTRRLLVVGRTPLPVIRQKGPQSNIEIKADAVVLMKVLAQMRLCACMFVVESIYAETHTCAKGDRK